MASKGIVINISGSGEGAAEALRQIEARMQETATHGKEAGEQLEAAWRKVETAFGALGIGVGFGEVVSKMKEMITTSMELGVEIGHLSQQTGISTENLSVLKYMSDQTGVGFESLSKAFKKLSTDLFEISQGAQLPLKAFQAIGISQKDLTATGGDLFKVMELVANRFEGMPDGFTKNAVATQLFGRAGQQLIPVLNQGAAGLEELRAKAKALGIVLDPETTEKAEKLHKAFVDMQASAEGAGLGIMTHLAPALEWLAKTIPDVLGVGGGAHGQDFSGGLDAINEWADTFVHAIGRVSSAMALGLVGEGGGAALFDKMFPGDQSRYSGFLSGSSGTKQLLDSMKGIKGAGGGGDDGSGLNIPGDGISKLDRDFWLSNPRSILEALRQNEREITAAKLQAQQEATEAARKQIYPDVPPIPGSMAAQSPAASLDVEVPQALGPIKQDSQFGASAAQESAKVVTGFMDQLSAGALKGKVNFKSLVDSAIMDLDRWAMKIVEEKTILPALNALFGIGGEGGFNSAGYSTAALGADGQGLFAGGGDIDHGWAIVGDGGDGSGSEIFAPKGPGTILPHDVLEGMASGGRGGGGAPSVTINNINNSSSQVSMKQAGVSYDAQAKQFIIHTVLEDMNQGGPLSSAMSGFAPK